MAEGTDRIDILLMIGIYLTFVVFAAAVWSLKRGMNKKKKDKEE